MRQRYGIKVRPKSDLCSPQLRFYKEQRGDSSPTKQYITPQMQLQELHLFSLTPEPVLCQCLTIQICKKSTHHWFYAQTAFTFPKKKKKKKIWFLISHQVKPLPKPINTGSLKKNVKRNKQVRLCVSYFCYQSVVSGRTATEQDVSSSFIPSYVHGF